MEKQLRKAYKELYDLDDIQVAVLSYQAVEQTVKFIGSLELASAYEMFELLYSTEMAYAYTMLESFCREEDKDVRTLRVLLPFAFMQLIERLSNTDYANKVVEKLMSSHRSEMGSNVRLPLRFTTDSFKTYLFGGSMLRDILDGNILDIGIEDGMTLCTNTRIEELLSLKDMNTLHVNLNYFSKHYVPFDMVAAVRAVLQSQAKKASVMTCI